MLQPFQNFKIEAHGNNRGNVNNGNDDDNENTLAVLKIMVNTVVMMVKLMFMAITKRDTSDNNDSDNHYNSDHTDNRGKNEHDNTGNRDASNNTDDNNDNDSNSNDENVTILTASMVTVIPKTVAITETARPSLEIDLVRGAMLQSLRRRCVFFRRCARGPKFRGFGPWGPKPELLF